MTRKGSVMENIPNNNTFNQTENIPSGSAPAQTQAQPETVMPSQSAGQNTAQPAYDIRTPQNNSRQNFYNNYSARQSTVAYNTPSFTPSAQQTPIYRSTPTATNQSPSAIYNNSHTGNAPQYHYGNPTASGIINNGYVQEQKIKRQIQRNNNKTLRTLGNIAGLAIIVCLLRSTLLSYVALLFQGFLSTTGGLLLFNIFYQVLVIGGTFLVLHFILKGPTDRITKEKKYQSKINLSAPEKPFKAFLLIIISFGGCMAANYVTSFVFWLLEIIGFNSGYTSFEDPNGILETIVMFIGIAVIPPLIEEFSMRGVLLSSMQKYGNTFAIFASAFVFGIFHANFTQIPFAFMCGLFFAYTTIATKSLWPAIIVHAMNNGLSCISTVLIQHFDENVANNFFYITSAVGFALSIVALIIYLKLYKKERILKDRGIVADYSSAKKFRKFMSSPGMIIATIMYSLEAVAVAIMSSPFFKKLLEDMLSQAMS